MDEVLLIMTAGLIVSLAVDSVVGMQFFAGGAIFALVADILRS